MGLEGGREGWGRDERGVGRDGEEGWRDEGMMEGWEWRKIRGRRFPYEMLEEKTW